MALGVLPAGVALAAGDTGWQASGTDAKTVSNGLLTPAQMTYDVLDRTKKLGAWTFLTTSTVSGAVTIPWTWTGDHGTKRVRSALAAGIYRDGNLVQPQLLLNEGPADATGGFSYRGVLRLTLAVGDRYGFVLGASHDEASGVLRGAFTLASAPTITVPTSPVLVTAKAQGDTSAVVSYTASAADDAGNSVPVTCSPAAGSAFPLGETTVTCTAQGASGLSSSATFLVRVYANEPNIAWPTATLLQPNDSTTGSLRQLDQAYWYRVPVLPDSTIQVDLTHLAANYDLALFRDIGAAFTDVLAPKDLNHLTAEFASDAFSPSIFSPSIFSPSIFSPSIFSPSIFSPSIFSPSIFSPSIFSPSIFSPSIFSPSIFSQDAFSPSIFSPSIFSPSIFSPSIFSPSIFSPDQLNSAWSSAQVRSLIAVSANEGLSDESIRANTWNADTFFYLRVQGRNGASAPGVPFTLTVSQTLGSCTSPLDRFVDSTDTVRGTPGSAGTVVLTDSARLPGVPLGQLGAFAARPEVGGVVVDAHQVPRLRALNAQADRNAGCPYAKNLVAQELRNIVNSYRDSNDTLKYVVIAGGDDVVPFFRSADAAGLGPEQNYVPPVADPTASQAALRRNQVLSQDAYGAETDINLKGATVPVPDVAVGRLVESASEISLALTNYTARGGALPSPKKALVTGYDFLTDAADAVSTSLQASLPSGAVTDLITDRDVPPSTTTVNGVPDRRHSWTADDLRTTLFSPAQKNDIVYLAGHFSANSALAADYTSQVLSTEVADAATDYTNTLVVSAGCHSGYNIVDNDAVPGVTVPLDWVQALNRRGAIVLAGTGYQYGDTDFLEYSERLYADFATELRRGTGAVALGAALVKAKQSYLAATPVLSGIHQKALAEATLYGLPMWGLTLPSNRLPATTPATVSPTTVSSGPGAVLGLRTLDVVTMPTLTQTSQPFQDDSGSGLSAFTYLTGPNGVVTQPAQPALPLVSLPATANGVALRGVAWRGGTYADTAGVVPLTGAVATEESQPHPGFRSPVFFPRRLASINAYGAIEGDGGTRLLVTPAQHRSDGQYTSTMRRFSQLDYRLAYSGNTATYGKTSTYPGNTPSLAAPPAITGVGSTISGSTVTIRARVVGDPSAGIQSVWVTRTAERGPWYGAWTSVDLTQSPTDSTLWTGTLTLPTGQSPADVRYVVQALNGVGLVTMDDNEGYDYSPGSSPGLDPLVVGTTATALSLAAASSAPFGSTFPVTATLVANGQPLAGRTVRFLLGSTVLSATTDGNGVASTAIVLTETVGAKALTAMYDGDATYAGSRRDAAVTVTQRPTSLSATQAGSAVVSGQDSLVSATLKGGGVPLKERAVYFQVRQAGSLVAAAVRITGPDGVARLGALSLPAGTYAVTAVFGTNPIDLGGGRSADARDPENGPSTSNVVSLRVLAPPAITTTSLPDATAGTSYDGPVVVTGDPEPVVSVTGLPPGLSYGNGRIAGTTTKAGSYTARVTATNEIGAATRDLALTVRPGAPAAVLAISGGGQATVYGTPFGSPLVAEVQDAYGNPVAGATVTYSSPSTGPGTTPRTGTRVAGADGRVSLDLVAGPDPGAYDVTVRSGSGSVAFHLVNQYGTSEFSAPLNGPQDREPVAVGKDESLLVSLQFLRAAGTPLADTDAVALVATRRLRFSSRLEGSPVMPGLYPEDMAYDVTTKRFSTTANGTALGWRSGSVYVLRVTVLGANGVDLLAVREVRVKVR